MTNNSLGRRKIETTRRYARAAFYSFAASFAVPGDGPQPERGEPLGAGPVTTNRVRPARRTTERAPQHNYGVVCIAEHGDEVRDEVERKGQVAEQLEEPNADAPRRVRSAEA
jgi:hypothetical protein